MAKPPLKLSVLRHPGPAARGGRWVREAAEAWQRALEVPALWVSLFLLLGTWSLLPGGFLFAPRAAAGAIATQDYVATRDLLLPDEETTRDKQERARNEVLPVYDFDPGVIAERDGRLAALFTRGRRLLAGVQGEGGGAEEVQSELAAELEAERGSPAGLRITPEQLAVLVERRFSSDLEDRIRGTLATALRRGVAGNKDLLLENRVRGITLRNLATEAEDKHVDLFNHLGYPDEARDFLSSEVRDWPGLPVAARRSLTDFLVANLPPNLHLNVEETRARRAAAAAAAGPVFNQVRKGQMIVRKGDDISPRSARTIAMLRGDRRLSQLLPPLVGTFLLLSLTAGVLWLVVRGERVADHRPPRVLGETLLLLLGSLLGTKFCFVVAGALSAAFEAPPLNSFRSYAYAVPFAALALLAALLLGRNVALVLAFLFPLLASRMVDGESSWMILYGVAGSLAAVFALDLYQFKQRLVTVRVGLAVSLVNAVMVLLLLALAGGSDRGLVQVGFDLLCGVVGGLLVAAVASFAVPPLESLFAITTDIKLVELANTNLPLLRRLAFEAPGTFQHSLMVANLAKEGCEAIGADPVLAYTGGLYHDVGKVFRPDYFIENQRSGHNRHDKLLPSMSALVLINHVKDGLELAREHHLPQPVRDAIEQHHGTRLIKYFYNRALETRDPAAGEVAEDKYRYPGPKPQNKVMGVLMLADGVEAASRTLIEPTPAKIRALIRTIVEDCLRDGQLDSTDLTLSDIRKASESFLRVLSNIFHQRIDYPGLNFNAEPRRERRELAGRAS